MNYFGCAEMVRTFAPGMIAARRGTIVNVGCVCMSGHPSGTQVAAAARPGGLTAAGGARRAPQPPPCTPPPSTHPAPRSVSGFWSVPFMGHYSASKAALQALSDALRLELSPFGVRVVHAAPGFVKTGAWRSHAQECLAGCDTCAGRRAGLQLLSLLLYTPSPPQRSSTRAPRRGA